MRHKQFNPNRHRKHVPYGSKGYCGYGGESYSRKYGLFLDDVVDKRAFRQKIRIALHKILIQGTNE